MGTSRVRLLLRKSTAGTPLQRRDPPARLLRRPPFRGGGAASQTPLQRKTTGGTPHCVYEAAELEQRVSISKSTHTVMDDNVKF